LTPFLLDRRPLGLATYAIVPGSDKPKLSIRLCDKAAETISLHYPDLPFRLAGTHADLDRQIKAMQDRIRRKHRIRRKQR
jgi:hypothetical protein